MVSSSIVERKQRWGQHVNKWTMLYGALITKPGGGQIWTTGHRLPTSDEEQMTVPSHL